MTALEDFQTKCNGWQVEENGKERIYIFAMICVLCDVLINIKTDVAFSFFLFSILVFCRRRCKAMLFVASLQPSLVVFWHKFETLKNHLGRGAMLSALSHGVIKCTLLSTGLSQTGF